MVARAFMGFGQHFHGVPGQVVEVKGATFFQALLEKRDGIFRRTPHHQHLAHVVDVDGHALPVAKAAADFRGIPEVAQGCFPFTLPDGDLR